MCSPTVSKTKLIYFSLPMSRFVSFVLTFDNSIAHFQYVAYTEKYMKTITIGMEVMQSSNGTPNMMNIMAQSKTIACRVI